MITPEQEADIRGTLEFCPDVFIRASKAKPLMDEVDHLRSQLADAIQAANRAQKAETMLARAMELLMHSPNTNVYEWEKPRVELVNEWWKNTIKAELTQSEPPAHHPV